jgi:hypothetical protein
VTSNELLRLLRRAGAVVADRGKGGHAMVMLAGEPLFRPAAASFAPARCMRSCAILR